MDANWRSGWVALVIAVTARAILAIAAGLALWSLAPAALGWHTTVTMSGSMTPRIKPGDIVISRPIGHTTLKPGWVILADEPGQPHHYLVHRLHTITTTHHHTRYTTKGDANTSPDSDTLTRPHIHGIAVLLVPWIGRPYLWAHTHQWTPLATTTATTLTLIWLAALYQEPTHPQQPGSSGQQPQRRRRTRLSLATSLTTAALATAGLIAWQFQPAHAAYNATTPNTTNTLASGYYSCAKAPLAAPSSLVLNYPFDETSGSTATDASGNTDTGTYNGSYTLGRSKACSTDSGYSAYFDGSSGYVSTTTSFNNPQTFSEEVWFKTSTTAGGKIIGFGSYQTGKSPRHDRALYLDNNGDLNFGVVSGGFRVLTSSTAYNDGTWHLADATFSPTTGLALYVDGALIASDSTVTSAENYGTGYWRVAYDNLDTWPNQPTSAFYKGYLDDVSIYNTVLTASQIAAHYAARS